MEDRFYFVSGLKVKLSFSTLTCLSMMINRLCWWIDDRLTDTEMVVCIIKHIA